MMASAFVYLLHFARPYPGGQSPQHYLGVTDDLERRLREHNAGSSKSRLTRACFEKGIAVEFARSWGFKSAREAFNFERAQKRRKESYTRLCPHCQERGKSC